MNQKNDLTPLERAKAINLKSKGGTFLKLLTFHEIDLVLDVGANTGQFALNLFDIGYQGKVVSFEPLSSAYELLLANSQSHANWQVAERCAIGDCYEERKIHISKNSQSSSILPILPICLDAAPNSAYIGSEKIKVLKLSEIAVDYVNQAQAPLLKIDTQGYEYQVLQGAEEIIDQIRGIYLELSLIPLYEGEIVFEVMLKLIQEMGFFLYNLYPGFVDYRTGRLLQVNGVFFREPN